MPCILDRLKMESNFWLSVSGRHAIAVSKKSFIIFTPPRRTTDNTARMNHRGPFEKKKPKIFHSCAHKTCALKRVFATQAHNSAREYVNTDVTMNPPITNSHNDQRTALVSQRSWVRIPFKPDFFFQTFFSQLLKLRKKLR